ncbi:hypothetical protein GE061_015353 [Apolygus lucorum]|uniref:PWWP domain-containing protein n=1 Tax=Apolygus lucorum TaxID=248454 RepID=A0A8S9XPS6_APOLU|nr:hypothetical protein GE061_015353 [Apolygus lucorum]
MSNSDTLKEFIYYFLNLLVYWVSHHQISKEMSLIESDPSEIPLRADELTHISTLASTSASSGPIIWKKSSPLRTYSKKTISPAPPSPATVCPSPEVENEDKSRYGRARKLIPSDDFLSTDKKVSQYLKIRTANQFHNFRATYSNSKTRSTPKKPKEPRKSAPAGLCRSFSMNYLPQPEDDEASSKMASVLDLAAPTCTETVETPLPLQEYESDSESDSMVPQDYSVGDLVWAAIPTYPYWPAMITRDPVTSLPYKLSGSGNKSRTLWHVHFFGDKGMRGWVITRNTFVFDGLESYNNAKAEYLSDLTRLGKTSKKKMRALSRAFTVPSHYVKSWECALSEAESLLKSSRSDRLEYLITTYAPKIETLKKRQRSLSLCDLSSIPKRPRVSEPSLRRNSVTSKTTKQVSEPIKPFGISSRPKTVVRVIPTKLPKSAEKLEPGVSSLPGRDHVDPDSKQEASDTPLLADTIECPTPEKVSPTFEQTTPRKTSLLLGESTGTNQSMEVGQRLPDTSIQPEDPKDSSILSSTEDSKLTTPKKSKNRGRPKGSLNKSKKGSKLTAPEKEAKTRGRPKLEDSQKKSRKKPSLKQDRSLVSPKGVYLADSEKTTKSELVPNKSPKKPTSIPVEAAYNVAVKRPRGRPRKISLPTPRELESPNATPKKTKYLGRRSMPDPSTAGATPTILCAMGSGESMQVGVSPGKAKSQKRRDIPASSSPVLAVTRSGRQSKKPEVLPMFTSPKQSKHELKNNKNLPQPIVSIKAEKVDVSGVENLPRLNTEPPSKRKRLSGNGRKKKIKLEPILNLWLLCDFVTLSKKKIVLRKNYMNVVPLISIERVKK